MVTKKKGEDVDRRTNGRCDKKGQLRGRDCGGYVRGVFGRLKGMVIAREVLHPIMGR